MREENIPQNSITVASVISYLIDRKQILNCILSCLIGLVALIIGMIVCDKSFWNYMFVWLIPGSGVVILGTYAVSMTDKHPIILIFPPIIFFASLYIRFLVTYEYMVFIFILLQTIPFVVFWISLIKKDLHKETDYAVFSGLLSVFCFLAAVIIVSLLDKYNVISMPNSENQLLELLVYIEIATASIYFGIGFLNADLKMKHVISAATE